MLQRLKLWCSSSCHLYSSPPSRPCSQW
jgi:hypothetical protein